MRKSSSRLLKNSKWIGFEGAAPSGAPLLARCFCHPEEAFRPRRDLLLEFFSNLLVAQRSFPLSSFSRTILCMAFSLVLACGLGCKKKDSTPPTPHDQGTLAAATTDADSPFRIALTIAPDHPRMIKPTTFTLHISDPSGKALDGLTATGRLTMRAMNMGETQVHVRGDRRW